MAEPKVDESKKKNPLQKLKEGLDDKEEQLQVLSTFVRLGVVVWSGFILTLNYVTIPGLGEQERIDPTFIASVFTGALASFGLETEKKEVMELTRLMKKRRKQQEQVLKMAFLIQSSRSRLL